MVVTVQIFLKCVLGTNSVHEILLTLNRFMEPAVITVLGGVLPFGSIFIEMYFIFTSFWAYKIYYVYGFMLLVFLILMVVTICVTIVCTYFLLNAEDYRWYVYYALKVWVSLSFF